MRTAPSLPTAGSRPTQLEVELLDAMPDPGTVAAWRELAVAAENPFTSPEWLQACTEVFPARPLIVACRSPAGDLVGVVPLVVDARGGVGSPAEALVDWSGPACAPEDEQRVAWAVLSALDDGGRLSRPWTLTRCLTASGWLQGIRQARGPAYELIATNSEVELSHAQLSRPAAMSGKDRREIARLLRRLHDAHAVDIRCARSPEEAENAFAEFEQLHTKRWATLRSPDVARLHRLFARAMAEQGWLRLWTLAVDGQVVATLYGWRVGARSFAYMQAFDPAWSRHGVGILLLDHAVRAAREEGAEVFDMLRGQERHKARFENDRRTVRTFVLVRRGSYARLQIRSRQSAGQIWRRLPAHHRAAIKKAIRPSKSD